jgi:hypothetical protein
MHTARRVLFRRPLALRSTGELLCVLSALLGLPHKNVRAAGGGDPRRHRCVSVSGVAVLHEARCAARVHDTARLHALVNHAQSARVWSNGA